MNLKQRNLEEIANRTLDHYNQRAEAFWEGTREHDVMQNIAAMLQHIAADDPLTLLDFGCGPGRDLKVFTGLGHITIGLEAVSYTHLDVYKRQTQSYEPPEAPEIIVARNTQTAEQAAAQIVALLTARGLIDRIEDLADDWSI